MSEMKSIERCVGDFPILFEFPYSLHIHERAWISSTGDSELTGHIETVHGVFHVVACNAELAQAIYNKCRPASVYTATGPGRPVCVIDARVDVGR